MSALVMTLLFYAIGVSLVCVVLYRGRDRRDPLLDEVRNEVRSASGPSEKAKLLIEIGRLQHERTPWYEKNLSMIGVVAFVSMIVATGVQTITTTMKNRSIEELRGEIVELEADREDARSLLTDLRNGIVARHDRGEALSGLDRRILRHYLDAMVPNAGEESGAEVMRDTFETAMILQDFERAAEVIRRWDGDLSDTAVPADRLTLAEYYYMSGSPSASRELLDEVFEELEGLPVPMRVRGMALRGVLEDIAPSVLAGWLQEIAPLGRDESFTRIQSGISLLRGASAYGVPGGEDELDRE